MTPKQIRNMHEKTSAEIAELQNILKDLQSVCLHPDAGKMYRSNTGNFDVSGDSYWIKFNCPDCGKRWDEFHQ